MKTLSNQEYLDLLEYKLIALKQAKEQDSSWNYGIEELEQEIKTLKSLCN
jgi:hypothetical protein